MNNKDLSIIIVDDLQFSRIVVKTALKKAGYDGVRLADSATQALGMLNEKPADVVLADWMMPEMDGLELTDRIRHRDEEAGTYTAIILFTANEGVELLVEAFEHGVDDYLRKPPNPHELYDMVGNVWEYVRVCDSVMALRGGSWTRCNTAKGWWGPTYSGVIAGSVKPTLSKCIKTPFQPSNRDDDRGFRCIKRMD